MKLAKIEDWANTRYEEYEPDEFKVRYNNKIKTLKSEVAQLQCTYDQLNDKYFKKGNSIKKLIKQQKNKIIEAFTSSSYFFVPLGMDKLQFIQNYQSQFLDIIRHSQVYMIHTVELQIVDALDGLKIYPNQANSEEVQIVVLAQLDKILILEQVFRDWQFKVVQSPSVQNLMDYWKDPRFSYELTK